jgi:hypothetical protein
LNDDKLSCLACTIDACGKCAYGALCTKCQTGYNLFNFNRECAFKCYTCKGSQADCGIDLSSVVNETDAIKFQECGIGGCWAFRDEKDGVVTYSRGCTNMTCSADTEYESCEETSTGLKSCKRCCNTELCNSFVLDGTAGVSAIFVSFSLLVACLIQKIL